MKYPKILSPAGDKTSFLAAVAAGADAIYCGLKIFSARMAADNFSIEELSRLSKLAKSRHIDLYIAFNTIIKEHELDRVFNILCKLCRYVEFDALIIQDTAVIPLARQAGFNKGFHLSTLGNCSFAQGLQTAEQFGINTVVLPREFTIDEIKLMAQKAPPSIHLETFIHGALCYCVSGRCYWSSWFGGKSALRGRCVQPCRRLYDQAGQKKRYFSCLDFSVDVLAKILKPIKNIAAWKIEGRKKSPHYVYYTTKAYRLLRDAPERRKEALSYLDYAMGRISTHYNMLTHRKMSPLDHSSETGSGLMAGRIKNPAAPFFVTREPLYPMDLLRIGAEDDSFHDIQKVTRAVPKKGKYYLSKKTGKNPKTRFLKKGTPVYLIDRRGKELDDALTTLETQLSGIDKIRVMPVTKKFIPAVLPKSRKKSAGLKEMHVMRGRRISHKRGSESGIWISQDGYGVAVSPKDWLWLDPVIFPSEAQLCANAISKALKKGCKKFVLNAPWQLAFFKHPQKLNLWAGPFCNITNSQSAAILSSKGFSGVIVSPELDRETFLALPSKTSIPLGIVIHGNWPLGMSRIISESLALNKPFTSPMNETAWIAKRNETYYIYPNWPLDLTPQKKQLTEAGYRFLIHITEPVPKVVKQKDRPGLWNWNLKLL